MTLSEFELIEKYFNRPALTAGTGPETFVPLAIGDDAALIEVPVGRQLAVTVDTLCAGVHFPADADAGLVASKAVAVNLSDLAAMGAEPVAMTLALTIPEADENWLAAFSAGLERAVASYHCPLIGGDVTRGPLTVTIQAHGLVTAGRATIRGGVRPGDAIYVSGSLGAAGLALELIDGSLQADKQQSEALLQAYYQPEPRLALGRACAGIVSAGIDISDGLVADLGHLARKSGVAIRIGASDIPVSETVTDVLAAAGREEEALQYALSAGDDYELVLSIPPQNEDKIAALAEAGQVALTRIGRAEEGGGVVCMNDAGEEMAIAGSGYLHFGGPEG